MRSSRVIDLERLDVCATVAKRLRHAAALARMRSGLSTHELRLTARVVEVVERRLRARESIRAVAERTAALGRLLGISTAALRSAAAIDLMADPARVDALLREMETELAQLEALRADVEALRRYAAMAEATEQLLMMIRQAGDRNIGVAPELSPG